MKILLIGFIAFFAWSTLSVYLYVCKIRGLCDEPLTMPISMAGDDSAIATDSLANTFVMKKLAIPENLVIYFAFDVSDFNSNDLTEKYFDESRAYLKQDTQANLIIIGHTDAIGSHEYNQTLGFRRAQNIQHYLQDKGINGDKIKILSKGETEPAESNRTDNGRANNRRTVLTFKK